MLGTDARLNDAEVINEEVDPVAGIQYREFAELVEEPAHKWSNFEGEYYAVIGFWSLCERSKIYKCRRYFYVPNPLRRRYHNKEGQPNVSQVLYQGKNKKEVFFFYQTRAELHRKNYCCEEAKAENLCEPNTTGSSFEIGVINLRKNMKPQ